MPELINQKLLSKEKQNCIKQPQLHMGIRKRSLHSRLFATNRLEKIRCIITIKGLRLVRKMSETVSLGCSAVFNMFILYIITERTLHNFLRQQKEYKSVGIYLKLKKNKQSALLSQMVTHVVGEQLIFLHNINPESYTRVTRIKEMITKYISS